MKMKRLTTTVIAAVACLIFVVSPAHALKAIVATIALGEVQVSGIGKKNADISWEGNVVTQSNKRGVFRFSTTNLPQDCVGDLSDSMTTIQVVIHGCTIEQVVGGGVLATGQTSCWDSDGASILCAGTGHDGDIRAGAALSYTDNSDGTITDNNTGLMWEKLCDEDPVGDTCPAEHDVDTSYNWEEAFGKILTLNTAPCFAGHCDWRLPNVKELSSIVNYENLSPTVSAEFNNNCVPPCAVTECSCTASAFYYSSTSYARFTFTNTAWLVDFDDGYVLAQLGNLFVPVKSDIQRVRAVRGGP
jgi:hypothetical protein